MYKRNLDAYIDSLLVQLQVGRLELLPDRELPAAFDCCDELPVAHGEIGGEAG